MAFSLFLYLLIMNNLPMGETDRTLEERDTDFEDTDTWDLDDDSDLFDNHL